MRSSLTRSSRRSVLFAGAVMLVLTGVPVQAQGPVAALNPGWTLPNLVPDVRHVSITQLYVLDPETQTFVLGPPVFAFDTWSQNLGPVSVDLLIDKVPPEEVTPVAQCVSWIDPRVCRERRQVGGLVWHDPHDHYHFEDFARYELRKLLRNGGVDYSRRGLVAASEKVSFCLVDSQTVRDDAFPLEFYRNCNTPTVMGVSAGWADVYDASLPGQQFPRDHIADGRYALVVDMDYADHLFESDETDNAVEVIVEFSAGVTQVAIVDKRPALGSGGASG